MPAFPDRESSLLNKLYETAPWTAKLHQQDQGDQGGQGGSELGVTTSVPAELPPPPVVNGTTDTLLLPIDTLISTSEFCILYMHVSVSYV